MEGFLFLKVIRPPSRAVENTQDLYDLSAHTVRDEVGDAGDDELAGTRHAARSATVGVLDEASSCLAELGDQAQRRGRVALEKVVLDGLEVGESLALPAYFHGAGGLWGAYRLWPLQVVLALCAALEVVHDLFVRVACFPVSGDTAIWSGDDMRN